MTEAEGATRPSRRRNLAVLAAVAVLAAFFFAFDLDRYLSIATLKAQHAELLAVFERQPVLFVASFMLLHVTALALALPGAVLSFALAGGAIFGPLPGTIIVLCSLTLGDSLGFLIARYVLRDWARRRFARQVAAFDRGVERDGAWYLLSLRLMPAVPYFIINLGMGLTSMRVRTFAPASFLGLAPATALYVNAGTELARIHQPSDVLSARLVIAFVLLGLLPIATRLVFSRRISRA